ncbi:MAG: hypothetical protein S0880_37170 [Actinomycetota bacterium]|nr:hypothetical protein [Actinomycetota bacterium]
MKRLTRSQSIDEFVELERDEHERRAARRLRMLVERLRAPIEAELGAEFTVEDRRGALTLVVDGRAFYVASFARDGRLLLTDISGRFDGRL